MSSTSARELMNQIFTLASQLPSDEFRMEIAKDISGMIGLNRSLPLLPPHTTVAKVKKVSMIKTAPTLSFGVKPNGAVRVLTAEDIARHQAKDFPPRQGRKPIIQMMIIDLLRQGTPKNATDIAFAVGKNYVEVHRNLSGLVDKNLVTKSKSGLYSAV